MFTKINIKKFGLYKDFTWPEDLPEFGRVNIIYGRNYQGKTTMSRIFDSVGLGVLHKNYADGEFVLQTDDANTPQVTQANMEDCPYKVRVYNSDFVKRNLSWLNNEDLGEIKAFALLGATNNAVQEEIDKIKEKLGDADKKTGLRYELQEKEKVWEKCIRQQERGENKLENLLREKANREIKLDPYLVKKRNTYNVASLKSDIVNIKLRKERNSWEIIGTAERNRLIRIIDEPEKPMIAQIPSTKIQLKDFIVKVIKLVGKKIKMTQVLTELVENDLLQAWVNEGREINKGQHTCAFCGGRITDERWRQLNAHFNRESDELSRQLHECKSQLVKATEELDGYLEARGFVENNIYTVFKPEFETVMNDWNIYVATYKATIEWLIKLIEQRLNNLFKPVDPVSVFMPTLSTGKDYVDIVTSINLLVEKNNKYSRQIENEKEEARYELRLQNINHFCQTINYDKEQKILAKGRRQLESLSSIIGNLRGQIVGYETMLKMKELEKRDEGMAAQKVTNLLANHFGNGSLRLESDMPPIILNEENDFETPKHTTFLVKRGGESAKNLSDGEKSLIAFCYFITQLEDELKGPDADKLVVYIDDPISSLDSSHVFFMYSLIETVFIKNLSFCQLFISTHNLEFLKFTKRIRPVVTTGSKAISKYVVVKLGKGTTDDYRSEIRKMPEYLSKYMTEYNFLFEQIYEVAKLESDEEQTLYGEKYTQYYNIGNNMRKFLECYLFYRYPDTDDPLRAHLAQLFDENVPSAVNRVVNEYSHLAWAERGMRVMDVPEVATAARDILKALQKKDPEHYETLCKSVGVSHEI